MSSFGLALPSALLNLLFFQVLIWQFLPLANYGLRSRRQVVTAKQWDCLLCAKIQTSPWPRSSGATKHAGAERADVGKLEAIGAVNFLDLDDILAGDEGESIDPR